MRLPLIAALLASVFATDVHAQTYTAVNRLVVVPLNAADFEVIEARGEGPRGIWCAAADYALRLGGVNGTERIYVKTARGPSISGIGRKGVVFTRDAGRLSQAPSRSYSVSVRTVGQGLPIAHAYQFCRDYDFEDVFLRRKGY